MLSVVLGKELGGATPLLGGLCPKSRCSKTKSKHNFYGFCLLRFFFGKSESLLPIFFKFIKTGTSTGLS